MISDAALRFARIGILPCAALLSVVLSVCPQTALADSVTFITAIPVAQDEMVVRAQSEAESATGDETALNQRLISFGFTPAFAYGLTEDLSLFVQPVVGGNFQTQNLADHGRVGRNSGGFGDTLFFARYTLIQKDLVAATFRIAPLVGLYFPSGSPNLKDSFGSLPDYMQTGAGSYDPYLGSALSYQSVNLEFDASFTYRINTSGTRDFRLGDIAEFDNSFQYRLWPWPLPHGISNFLLAVIESNLIWQAPTQIGLGSAASYTGGVTWLIDTGFRYDTEFAGVGAVFRIPVAQYLKGPQLTNDLGFLLYVERYFTMPSWLHG